MNLIWIHAFFKPGSRTDLYFSLSEPLANHMIKESNPSLQFLHQDGVSQAVINHNMVRVRYPGQLTGHPHSISSTNMRLGKAWDQEEWSSNNAADYRKNLPSWPPSVHAVSKHGQFSAVSVPKHGLVGHSWALLHVPPHCRQQMKLSTRVCVGKIAGTFKMNLELRFEYGK